MACQVECTTFNLVLGVGVGVGGEGSWSQACMKYEMGWCL